MSREELIEIVRRIMDAEGSEEQIDEAIDLLQKSTNDPNILDLIFYDNLIPPEVVDKALAYSSILLNVDNNHT